MVQLMGAGHFIEEARELVQELTLAGRDLVRLATNREQLSQLLGVFVRFEYIGLTSQQLKNRLLLFPFRLFEVALDVITVLFEEGLPDEEGLLTIDLVAPDVP